MKRRFSLNQILHNDKLMMVLSLILAIIIWRTVVYGAGNYQEREITGVPISITLNDYASETMKLRVVDGADATATVKVSGVRSVIDHLSAQDITITADTGNVIKEGIYVLQLRAVANGDFSILNVVGKDGTTSTTTITCDVWSEQEFPVTVEMPNLTVSDSKQYQFGTPSISGAAVTNNAVKVSGPRTDINRIKRLIAKISAEQIISETAVFEAELIAYDEHDLPIKTVSFVNAEDAKLSVTVPVMIYRKVELSPTVNNIPEGYKDKSNLVTVSPKEIELWSVPSELEEYINKIQQLLTVDFNQLGSDGLSREIVLNATQGVRLVNSSETITMKINLSNITMRTVDVSLSEENFRVENCPEGLSVSLKQLRLPGIRICGPSSVVSRIRTSDIVLVLDMTGKTTTGQQVVKARLLLPKDTAWVYYDDPSGVEIQVEVTSQ